MRRPPWNRVHGIRLVLAERRESAKQAAAAADPNGQHAASLRGKVAAYREADELIAALERGHLIHRNRRWRGNPR